MNALILGYNGFVSSSLVPLLLDAGMIVRPSAVRFTGKDGESALLRAEIIDHRIDCVVCCIGRTHPPGQNGGTIDYLEDNPDVNVRDNMFAPVMCASICNVLGVHFTYIGSGCIFEYTDIEHPELGPIHTESSAPNFKGSQYSMMKGYTDQIMSTLPVLNIRIRMPITDIQQPRNLIDKLVKYPKIHSVPNSMSVMNDLMPILASLVYKRECGTFNLVCKGVITHREIIEMYTEIVDPTHTCEYITTEKLQSLVSAGRSNCHLSTDKLESMFDVPDIHDSVRRCMIRRKDYATSTV